MDIKPHTTIVIFRVQGLCENGGGHAGLPVPNYSPRGLCGRKATLEEDVTVSVLRSCGKSLGSPSLIIIMVSVDVKQHWWRNLSLGSDLERCEEGGGAGLSYQDGLSCCCVMFLNSYFSDTVSGGRWSWTLISGRVVLLLCLFLNSYFSDTVSGGRWSWTLISGRVVLLLCLFLSIRSFSDTVFAGRWSWTRIAGWVVLLLSLFLYSCFSDTVFVTLFCTALERAS